MEDTCNSTTPAVDQVLLPLILPGLAGTETDQLKMLPALRQKVCSHVQYSGIQQALSRSYGPVPATSLTESGDRWTDIFLNQALINPGHWTNRRGSCLPTVGKAAPDPRASQLHDVLWITVVARLVDDVPLPVRLDAVLYN